ncbi:MAG: hypothetical protein HYX69_10610 [Planctomycetia bacterium]|nr:hypothetical protein [Planctomycetia bacterium]
MKCSKIIVMIMKKHRVYLDKVYLPRIRELLGGFIGDLVSRTDQGEEWRRADLGFRLAGDVVEVEAGFSYRLACGLQTATERVVVQENSAWPILDTMDNGLLEAPGVPPEFREVGEALRYTPRAQIMGYNQSHGWQWVSSLARLHSSARMIVVVETGNEAEYVAHEMERMQPDRQVLSAPGQEMKGNNTIVVVTPKSSKRWQVQDFDVVLCLGSKVVQSKVIQQLLEVHAEAVRYCVVPCGENRNEIERARVEMLFGPTLNLWRECNNECARAFVVRPDMARIAAPERISGHRPSEDSGVARDIAALVGAFQVGDVESLADCGLPVTEEDPLFQAMGPRRRVVTVVQSPAVRDELLRILADTESESPEDEAEDGLRDWSSWLESEGVIVRGIVTVDEARRAFIDTDILIRADVLFDSPENLDELAAIERSHDIGARVTARYVVVPYCSNLEVESE